MTVNFSADRAVHLLASRQHGALSHEQALRCGLTPDQIRARVESGRWIRVAKGVYVVAGSAATWQRHAMAACLAGPAGTLASTSRRPRCTGCGDRPSSHT
jgi:hypothetical protein